MNKLAHLNPSLMYILKEPFIYYNSCPLLSFFLLSERPTAVDKYSKWRSVKRNTVSHPSASMQIAAIDGGIRVLMVASRCTSGIYGGVNGARVAFCKVASAIPGSRLPP
jgi:hypothetical protein